MSDSQQSLLKYNTLMNFKTYIKRRRRRRVWVEEDEEKKKSELGTFFIGFAATLSAHCFDLFSVLCTTFTVLL